MSFDITRHFDAVSRVVGTTERDGLPARTVVATCRYATDVDDLWDAITTADRLRRWFLPVSGELKLGGRYQFEGNAGGQVTACEPPRRLAATWEFGGEISWVDVVLRPDGDAAVLELTHTAAVVKPEFWNTYGPGAVGVGWDLGLMGLARHLADPSAERPPEAAADWATSPEAKDIYRRTSLAWGRAAVAGGDPEDAAMRAAENTRKFYSGEPPAES